MTFLDLRSFLAELERRGQLARITREVDPNQEITIIQHRVLSAGGPALLFEHVKGSPYRLVSNLFGTPERVELAFGRPAAEIGQELADLAHRLLPPSPRSLWRDRRALSWLLKARLRKLEAGPVMDQTHEPPRLSRLPVLTCWPLDGGPFFTLPLVHTIDPATGIGNLGIYRLQRYDDETTGMHWQIAKGGGFHYNRACQLGRALPVSVILGGPPALMLAAIAPLPEDFDERLLAALIMRQPLDVIPRPSGHAIPARAEFVLEGSVDPCERRREGPFGDHLGHYSYSADFPVFRVQRVLSRRDAIYPATVVGKPPQEDYFIGEALEELTIPLLRLTKPGISDLWAYPETGFHPLAVAAVRERYGREALKHAWAILGEGQLSLTKVLIVVDEGVPVRNFEAVSEAIWRWFDPAGDLHVITPTAQDTLDFTGPAINAGSRLIILATGKPRDPLRSSPPPALPGAVEVHPGIAGLRSIGPAFVMAQLRPGADAAAVRRALADHPSTGQYLFHVLVSSDVPLHDTRMALWGWFTRFDPFADLHPARREVMGNRLVLHPPFAIDATWKPGYRRPVEFDPRRLDEVEQNWGKYGI